MISNLIPCLNSTVRGPTKGWGFIPNFLAKSFRGLHYSMLCNQLCVICWTERLQITEPSLKGGLRGLYLSPPPHQIRGFRKENRRNIQSINVRLPPHIWRYNDGSESYVYCHVSVQLSTKWFRTFDAHAPKPKILR